MNCDEDLSKDIAQIVGCTIGKMPFMYLGLPLGTSKTLFPGPNAYCMQYGKNAHIHTVNDIVWLQTFSTKHGYYLTNNFCTLHTTISTKNT